MSTPEGRALGEALARIARLERQIAGLSTPQLVHSSIEGGATKIRGDSGELTGLVGRQYDGTFGAVTVWGPTPPKPSVLPGNLTVTPIAGGLRVRYDGGFDPAFVESEDPDVAATPVVAPQDFSRFEVHSDQTNSFTGLLWLTLRRTIESARGGEVEFGVPQDTDIWIRLVSRTTAGRTTASDVVGPFRAGKVAEGDIALDFSVFGGTTVYYGATEPQLDPEVTLNYGDLWLKEVAAGPPAEYETYRWMPQNAWVQLADQRASQALEAAIFAEQIAKSKADVFYQDEAPTGLTADDEAVWFDTNDGNRARSWDTVTLTWVDRLLGNGSIQPGSLVASDLIATGTVTATLLEAVLVLASVVVAGNPNGAHVKLSELGIDTYDLGPDGEIQRTGGLGTGDDGFGLIDPVSKETTVAFTRAGDGAVKRFSVAGVDDDADNFIDGGMDIYGREFTDWLGDHSRGAVASAFYADAASGIFASNITTPFGLGELSFEQDPDRSYMIVFDGLHYSMPTSAGRALITVRGTIDGTTPTITNGTVYGSKFVEIPAANYAMSAPAVILYGNFAFSAATVRLLVMVQRYTGTSTLTVHTYSGGNDWRAPFRFFAVDLGRNIADTYIANDGGGVRSGGSPSATPKKTYTSTWAPSFVGSYYGSGVRRTDTTDLYQGQTPYYTAGGNQKALAGFTGNAISGETTKTITGALSGATVSKVEIYLYCNHSHYNWGGRGIIGYHGNTTLPTTAPNASYSAFGQATFSRGQGRWITLPSTTHASWQNGTYRGITTGPGPTTAADYYMRFAGTGAQRPLVRITYTR